MNQNQSLIVPNNSQEPEMVKGENKFQFSQFLLYLEHRRFIKEKFSISESEFYKLNKKFNWKLRAKAIDNKAIEKMGEEFEEKIINEKSQQLDICINLYEQTQANMKVFLEQLKNTPDYLKVNEDVDFTMVTKRMNIYLRTVNTYLKTCDRLKSLLGIDEEQNPFNDTNNSSNDFLLGMNGKIKSLESRENEKNIDNYHPNVPWPLEVIDLDDLEIKVNWINIVGKSMNLDPIKDEEKIQEIMKKLADKAMKGEFDINTLLK